jgi:hypothetical protein
MSEETKEPAPDGKVKVNLGEMLEKIFTRIYNLEVEVSKLRKERRPTLILPGRK